MTKNILGIFFLILLSIGCKSEKEEGILEVDHILVWVKDPIKMKSKIEDLGFNGVPDSLSQIHNGQGTAGRYFRFLNSYLELIFVNNIDEFQDNVKANNLENGFSPFGIGLKMKKYAPNSIPFETIKYRQDWMEEGKNIYLEV